MLSEEEFYLNLSQFIKNKRQELQYTNEELSFKSNVDAAKISLLQNNKQGCSAFTLYKLLYALDLNIFNDDKNNKIPNMNNEAVKNAIDEMEKIIVFLKKIY